MTPENQSIIIAIADRKGQRWISQVNNEVKNLSNASSTGSQRWRKQSVYRVPTSLKDLCHGGNPYTPQTVSIGPYHHGEERLKGMEEHKHRALLHFLCRSGKPLESYLGALDRVAGDLKDAYDQLEEKWQRDADEAFLQLMIVDGCFILELLRTTTPAKAGTESKAPQDLNREAGYAENDPVFSDHGKLYIVPYLKRDMLMLENQLPLLVLTTLIAVEKNTPTTKDNLSAEDEVTRLILNFFYPHEKRNTSGKCLHMLDVYRNGLLWIPDKQKTEIRDDDSQRRRGGHNGQWQDVITRLPRQPSSCWPQHKSSGEVTEEIIRSATELLEAGIKIKPSKTHSLKDISFHRGLLKLPLILVDDTLESAYLNLMAFERFHVGAGNEVTSYVFFMDGIIDSARDVSLLHTSGIIQNALGSDKAVAELFNSLSKDISLDPNSSLGNVHKRVSAYCRKPWPRWKASLKHNYFTNPWAGISVVAAIFLFALAGLQTYYSVLSYYNSS